MKDIFKNFENADFCDVHDYFDDRVGIGYLYYIEGNYDMFFQEAARKEIPFKEYKSNELKVLKWIKSLAEKSRVVGIVSPNIVLESHYSFRKSIDYRNRMHQFAKQGKLDKVIQLQGKELDVAIVMGLRDAVQTMFYFKAFEMIIVPLDLHGIVLFNANRVIETVKRQAEKYGIILQEALP